MTGHIREFLIIGDSHDSGFFLFLSVPGNKDSRSRPGVKKMVIRGNGYPT